MLLQLYVKNEKKFWESIFYTTWKSLFWAPFGSFWPENLQTAPPPPLKEKKCLVQSCMG